MAMSSLPKKIQVDIFLKLPVNSIGICRCVSKVWCSLLSKPKFIKTQLDHTINPRFIVHKKDSWGSMISSVVDGSISSAESPTSPKLIYSETLRKNFPFAYNEQLRYSSLEIIGSCNGFACFIVSYSSLMGDTENTICLWNPSTREYIDIPRFFDRKAEIGFGYDNNIDDYKVVIIRDNRGKIHGWGNLEVEVHTSNFSRILPQQKCYIFPGESGSGFLFNGALHWPGYTEALNRVIIYFDINNDKLADFTLPEHDFPPAKLKKYQSGTPYDKLDTTLGVLSDRLCLAIDVGNSRTDIWVMQDYGVSDSWAKLFSTLTYCSFMRPRLRLDNREILMDTKVGLVLLDKKCERWRDLKVNTESVHALLLWDS